MRELPLTLHPAPLPVTPVGERSHRQHYLPGRLLQILTDHVGISTLGMTPAEHAEAAVELERAIGMLTGLQLDHLAHLDHADIPATSGASTTAGWLHQEIPVSLRAARRKVKLAKRIDADSCRLGTEVVTGRVLPEQAEVIAAAVDALPADLVDPDTRARAEAHLVELAAVHDPDALRRLGERILQLVAPQVADAVDAARIAAMEAEADKKKSLRWSRDGHGSVHGRFTIPERHGAMLAAALAGFANPSRPDPIPRHEHTNAQADAQLGGGTTEPGPAPGRRWRAGPDVDGEAFCQLLESLDPSRLPRTSGMNATVVAIIPVSTLTGHPTDPTDPTGSDPRPDPEQPTPGQPSPGPRGGCSYCRRTGSATADSTGTGAGTATGVNGAAEYRPTGQAPGHLLGTDIELSPAQARRMACRAGVIPAVLDGAGRVLDLGRKSRLASPAQILALRIHQHGRCAITGCDRPAHTCEAHHWRRPWARGGPTNLDNLILLCPTHHVLADTDGYHTEPQPDGRFRLHRRQ